jgi:glycosyltransferase involved in cell wall biosynthesis
MSAVATSHRENSILIAGGHSAACGGLEAFIARARACLRIESHVFTETPGYGAAGVRTWLRAMGRFVRLARSHDVIWIHYGSAFDLAFLLLAKMLGKTAAVTPHLGATWRAMRNPVLRALSNRILSLADAVFTLHQTQPQALHFPASVSRRCIPMGTFLPNALLEGDAPARTPGRPLKLVHVARLSAEKGSFAFLDVCEVLRRRGIAVEGTIIGQSGAEVRNQIAAIIAQRKLPIALLEALPQDAFLALFRRQDVLVNLSLQDAYPLTVIEALLCGVAPVCSALPGTRELAADAPAISLVEGQDAEAAADSIVSIDWSALAYAGAVMRRKFHWAGLERRYRECFAALAAKGSSASSRLSIQVRAS